MFSSCLWLHGIIKKFVNMWIPKNDIFQWGLEYRTFEFRIHMNSEHFKIWILNGSVFESILWFESTIWKPNFQNGRSKLGSFIYKEKKIMYAIPSIFAILSVGFIKRPSLERPFLMLRMFCFQMVGTRTERLWTIRIPNLFGIRAPTVITKSDGKFKKKFQSFWFFLVQSQESSR